MLPSTPLKGDLVHACLPIHSPTLPQVEQVKKCILDQLASRTDRLAEAVFSMEGVPAAACPTVTCPTALTKNAGMFMQRRVAEGGDTAQLRSQLTAGFSFFLAPVDRQGAGAATTFTLVVKYVSSSQRQEYRREVRLERGTDGKVVAVPAAADDN